nr:putative ascorbate-specific transmembrane electron transporter 1 [Quercus suber]
MAYKTVQAGRRSRELVHLTLHLIALLLELLGVYAAFMFNHDFNVEEMLTLHSWLGIIAICLFGLQWVFAFLTYCFPKAENLTRAMILPWHGFFRMVIFLLAICTAETRFVEIFISLALERNQEALVRNFTGLLIFLFAVSVTLSVILPRSDKLY